jgi:hypothetical protein
LNGFNVQKSRDIGFVAIVIWLKEIATRQSTIFGRICHFTVPRVYVTNEVEGMETNISNINRDSKKVKEKIGKNAHM